jgi:arylsulfatase
MFGLAASLAASAGADYPKVHEGREVPELIGTSWNRMLRGQAQAPRSEKDFLAWQLFGNRKPRIGKGFAVVCPTTPKRRRVKKLS